MSASGRPGGRPPRLTLVAGDRVFDGVEGSSIWGGMARDALLQLPARWHEVGRGEEVRFESAAPPANEVFLTVYTAASVAEQSMAATVGVELDADAASWRVDLEPGRYVVTLSRTWDGRNSVVHAFGLEVHDAPGR